MKKLFLILFLGFLSSTIAQQSLAADLCIGLLNKSGVSVNFMGSDDPGGDTPEVVAHHIRVLRGDYWLCTNFCWAMVSQRDPAQRIPPSFTTIKNLPRGTLIIYYGPNNYTVDKGASIKCDWATS